MVDIIMHALNSGEHETPYGPMVAHGHQTRVADGPPSARTASCWRFPRAPLSREGTEAVRDWYRDDYRLLEHLFPGVYPTTGH